MGDLEKTLHWLIPILDQEQYRYHISGGFGAHLYGASRSVNDIDIALPQSDFLKLSEKLKEYSVYGPKRYTDPPWDLWLTTLNKDGQLIDLSGDESARVFNKHSKDWMVTFENFDTAIEIEKFGLKLKVQNPQDLMSYKRVISWKGDDEKHLSDVEAIESWVKNDSRYSKDIKKF